METLNKNIEKILLGMKYDSRKTLSENKKYILESCIPLETELTDFSNGKNRSNEYPELGKWGDGTCKCLENTRCLEFKKNCCGKVNKVQSGKLTQSTEEPKKLNQDYQKIIGYNGSEMILPTQTIIGKKNNCSNLKFYYGDAAELETLEKSFPKIVNACKNQPTLDLKYEECVRSYVNTWLNMCVNDSIASFELDGLTYRPCFSVGSIDKGFKKPEDTEMIGYYGLKPNELVNKTDGDCPGVKWEGMEEYKSKVKNGKPTDNKNAIEGGQGDPDLDGSAFSLELN
jgi:hypothetical protein